MNELTIRPYIGNARVEVLEDSYAYDLHVLDNAGALLSGEELIKSEGSVTIGAGDTSALIIDLTAHGTLTAGEKEEAILVIIPDQDCSLGLNISADKPFAVLKEGVPFVLPCLIGVASGNFDLYLVGAAADTATVYMYSRIAPVATASDAFA